MYVSLVSVTLDSGSVESVFYLAATSEGSTVKKYDLYLIRLSLKNCYRLPAIFLSLPFNIDFPQSGNTVSNSHPMMTSVRQFPKSVLIFSNVYLSGRTFVLNTCI